MELLKSIQVIDGAVEIFLQKLFHIARGPHLAVSGLSLAAQGLHLVGPSAAKQSEAVLHYMVYFLKKSFDGAQQSGARPFFITGFAL